MIRETRKNWVVLIGIKPQFPEIFKAAAELDLRILSITPYNILLPQNIQPEISVTTDDLSLKNIKRIVKHKLQGQKPLAYYTAREESLIATAKLNKDAANAFVPQHQTVLTYRDKHLVRKKLDGSSFNTPYALVSLTKTKDPFPGEKKVVKPLTEIGSNGVIAVFKDEDFKDALENCKNSYMKNLARDNYCSEGTFRKAQKYVLVEKFIEGDQYTAEMFVHKGKAVCLTLCGKTQAAAPYFEETYNYAPLNAPKNIYKNISANAVKIIEHLGIDYGPVHMEVSYNKGKLTVVEVNLRLGGSGWLHKLVYGSTGINYIKAVLAQITGGNPEPFLKRTRKDIAVLTISRTGSGGYVNKLPDINKMPLPPQEYMLNRAIGDITYPRPYFTDLPGYFIFNLKGQDENSFKKAKKIIEEAEKHLQFSYQLTPVKKGNYDKTKK